MKSMILVLALLTAVPTFAATNEKNSYPDNEITQFESGQKPLTRAQVKEELRKERKDGELNCTNPSCIYFGS